MMAIDISLYCIISEIKNIIDISLQVYTPFNTLKCLCYSAIYDLLLCHLSRPIAIYNLDNQTLRKSITYRGGSCRLSQW